MAFSMNEYVQECPDVVLVVQVSADRSYAAMHHPLGGEYTAVKEGSLYRTDNRFPPLGGVPLTAESWMGLAVALAKELRLIGVVYVLDGQEDPDAPGGYRDAVQRV